MANQVFAIENVNSQTLSIINKCREVLQNADTNLQNDLGIPQIAVIGLQSAGKSSLLNGILGHQLFESKEGMCTRHPVNFELHPISEEEFANIKRDFADAVFRAEVRIEGAMQLVYTIDMLRQCINVGTNHILSNTIGVVSNTVLHVRIYKCGFPELSLIDLPGIIDTQDQVKIDIEEIVKTYIINPKTIIVLAQNCTNDYQTNRLFYQIKEFDLNFERTVLVYTKCDMLQGNFSRISNEIDHFKANKMFSKGIFLIGGLRDSSTDNTFMASQLGLFKAIAGVDVLSKNLVLLLDRHIKKTLPDFCKMVHDRHKNNREQMASLGEVKQDMNTARVLAQKFIKNIEESFGGSVNIDGVADGVHLLNYFHGTYRKDLDLAIRNIEHFDKTELDRIIANSYGMENCFTAIPRDIQLTILKRQTNNLKTLKDPSIACLNYAIDLVKKSGQLYSEKVIGVFPDYATFVQNKLISIVYDLRDRCEQYIIETVECAETFICNTKYDTKDDPIKTLILYFKETLVPELLNIISRYLTIHLIKKLFLKFNEWLSDEFYNEERDVLPLLAEDQLTTFKREHLKNIDKALMAVKLELSKITELGHEFRKLN